MENLNQLSKDYNRVEKAIRFLDENFKRQPSLQETAENLGLSEFHFQRIFTRWAGVSPKKFLQFLTKEYARDLLKRSNLLDVTYETGLSAPSRLHDLFVSFEAMSPGEYKLKGKGLAIDYGFHPSPFGECFIALTDRGVCSLLFLDKVDRIKILKQFRKDWVNAKINQNQDRTRKFVERIFAPLRFRMMKEPIQLFCRGTNFQIKVWEALLRIPFGAVMSYKSVAQWIECPKAMRAVGSAIGKNPIAYLVPCHRVIRSVGQPSGYRWGVARKKAMLGMEAATLGSFS